VEEAFYPLPILKVPLFNREIVGVEMLKKTAEQLFANIDPAEVLYRGETQKVVKKGQGYRMTIPLPIVEKEDIELSQMEHELIVKIGNYRRDIILPRVLLGMQAAGASFEDHHLVLDFIPSPPDKEDENG
jgi:arsenite-transporting ATPase